MINEINDVISWHPSEREREERPKNLKRARSNSGCLCFSNKASKAASVAKADQIWRKKRKQTQDRKDSEMTSQSEQPKLKLKIWRERSKIW